MLVPLIQANPEGSGIMWDRAELQLLGLFNLQVKNEITGSFVASFP